MAKTATKMMKDMTLEELNALEKKEMTEFEIDIWEKCVKKLSPKPSPVPKPAKTFVEESREVLKFPPPPGMKYFESPEGIIMVGEASTDRLWCKQANGGKGADILPMREGNPLGENKLKAKKA